MNLKRSNVRQKPACRLDRPRPCTDGIRKCCWDQSQKWPTIFPVMNALSTLMGRNLWFTSETVSIAPSTTSRTSSGTKRFESVSCDWSPMVYGEVGWVTVTQSQAAYSIKSTFTCVSRASLSASDTMCSNITPPARNANDLLWILAMKVLNARNWAVVQCNKQLECNR